MKLGLRTLLHYNERGHEVSERNNPPLQQTGAYKGI
jgi:hypothetical protein